MIMQMNSKVTIDMSNKNCMNYLMEPSYNYLKNLSMLLARFYSKKSIKIKV